MGVNTKTDDEESAPLDDQKEEKNDASSEGKPDDDAKKDENQTENENENAVVVGGLEESKDGYQPLFTRKPYVLRCLIGILVIFVIVVLAALIVLIIIPGLMAYYTPPMYLAIVKVAQSLQSTPPFDVPRNLTIPKGFEIEAYGRVPSARFLLPLPNGDVLVSQPREGQISLLKRPARENMPVIKLDFATGLHFPQDMLLYTDERGDKYIYVAESTRITRHFYEDGDVRLSSSQNVVSNLPYAIDDENPYKGIAIGNGTLYVSIGSSSDSNPIELTKDPKRGAVYGYRAVGGQRRLIAEGIRSAEGLAFFPGTNDLWAVVKQRINIKYPFKGSKYGILDPEFVDYNPPEEFSRVIEGENYGWPYCNPNFKISKGNDIKYVADVETNPDETDVKCSSFRKIDFPLPPHTVPLGLTFWAGENAPKDYRNGALVALYEVNSKTGEGNSVIFIPWDYGKPVYYFDLVKGWVLDLETKERWGRPVDTAVLQDGSILISDDMYGAIYRLYKTD
uniref:Pyrroloquinoline quinone-dependent pyranose dehydrogenase beta-propeller domain-containing protein n=1 Tax=Strigamia maritima TaxID=126957 RepID=T1INY7_STRMM